jgi:hypothetical protein
MCLSLCGFSQLTITDAAATIFFDEYNNRQLTYTSLPDKKGH